MSPEQGVLVGIDIGGTFTDVVSYDEASETYRASKVPTTPGDLSQGVVDGVADLLPSFAAIRFGVHGTTAGLNAFLERRGERVMLIATQGVGDSYLIARGNRTSLYDIHYRRPRPLVPRSDIVEVGGRLDYRGEELVPLDEDQVRAAAERFRAEDFGAVAVCLLFSYLNPAHELRVAELLRESVGDAAITLSHAVSRQWREYERTSTAVMEAYVGPTIRSYVKHLGVAMEERGMEVPMHVMQSSGGVMSAEGAIASPLQTLLSGPTGGAIGGATLARELDRPNLILVDMGGTSFDVSLVVDGQADVANDTELEGHALLMPVVRIHTVGAGGGSVAYLEAGGLRVGPRSAGAQPGPACYGRGGLEPTVTDANAFLGRLVPEGFADWNMTIDVGLADQALARVAEPLGIGQRELAEGILAIVNARMAQAIRTITVEKGIELRDFSLVAFGGAGPMHAAFLAQELEIGEVLVPPLSGAFSAWGLLQTGIRLDHVSPFFRPLAALDLGELEARLETMIAESRQQQAADGVVAEQIAFEASADMRYVGQEYTVPAALEPRAKSAAELVERFEESHRRHHGHCNHGAEIELVSLRVTAHADLHRPGLAPQSADDAARSARSATAVFGGREHDTAVIRRGELAPGSPLSGPVIVEEPTTTVVVPPGASLAAGSGGVLEIAIGKEL
jgi:N-methylhydantoinase A